jgi:hypothetical protein
LPGRENIKITADSIPLKKNEIPPARDRFTEVRKIAELTKNQ